MVASVPELAKRQRGSPQRRASSPATAIAFSRRLREVGAALHLGLDRRDDGRVGVPGQGGAVAAVQVHVLVAVRVVDLAARAVAEPDRLRLVICQLEVTPPASTRLARRPGRRSSAGA